MTKGIHSSATTWSTSAKEPVSGLHQGAIEFITLKYGPPSGVSVAFWNDATSSSSRASTTSTGAVMDGEFPAANGTTVKFRCQTQDGTNAVVTIDGNEFDSRQGSLFLIASTGERLRVTQLKVDISNLPKTAEQIMAFAQEHSEIEEFFRDANAPPPADKQP